MRTTTAAPATATATTSHSRLRWIVMVALLCGHVGTSSSAATATTNGSSITAATTTSSSISSSNGGIISLKLIPHHVESDRRRRDRRLREQTQAATETIVDSDNDNDNDKDSAGAVSDGEQYRRREEAMQIGALFEGYGTHYVDLWCGSPPQRQTVIVDTGSGITAFPCSGCNDCGAPAYHIDQLFLETDSSTFAKSTCSSKSDCIMSRSSCDGFQECAVRMAYAEGSMWNAYEAVDRCYIAGPHETPLVVLSKDGSLEGDDMNPRHATDLAFDMTFGCQTLVTGLFKTQLADGIMGMSNLASTYWSQMFEAGKMGADRQFALCFSRPPQIDKIGTEAGAMTMGGVDTRLHLTPMVYTPAFDTGRSSFFSVHIRRVMLREGKHGESAQSTSSNPNEGVTVLEMDPDALNRGGTIVDSGTTDTYFNRVIAQEFQRVFQKITGKEYNHNAVKLTDEELKALPTILLQLSSDASTNSHVDEGDVFHTPGLAGALDKPNSADVILAIPPSHYMEYNPGADTYTSRFYPTEPSGNVLGANAIMGHDVFFDMENKRLGWAESACDYTATVKEHGYDFEITGEMKPVEEAGDTHKIPKHNNNGNKHSTNNGENDEVTCESISSGSKCQTIEGCTWGWGKCTKTGDAPAEEPPTDAPVPSTQSPEESPPASSDKDTEQGISQALVQKIQENTLVAGILLVFSLLVCCTCTYCLCCRNSKNESKKYTRASRDRASIEMTNGKGRESFQDDPSDDDDDDDDDDDYSGSGSKFRDEPEFEGDFA
mmetsp:Transcript_10152/g.21804  ORF Transcript_10152/g.21804 Transcript_10152/m.21804 type:complete len:773 (+) Transcript_10152:341-2659(+)